MRVSPENRWFLRKTSATKHADANKKYFRELQRKRASIEPVIGHLKQDHRLNRCRYKGFDGDQINVSLAVTAWNAKKWMRQMIEERRKAG
jgi:IS5 family transposase